MIVRFYVSAEGEVLSPKDYPVRHPWLLIPLLANATPIEAAAVSAVALTDMRIATRVYQAITVQLPDDLMTDQEGIIR